MIVSVRNRGKMEFRSAEFGSSAIPLPGFGSAQYSGVRYDTDVALGLSAVGAAVRLISLLIASMDLCVFTGTGADKRASETSWQDKLLDNPNPDQSQFDLLSDIATGPETLGNSLVLKVKHLISGKVVALIPLDMNYASITRDSRTKEKVIKVTADGVTQQYSAAEVIHFRGWTLAGKVSGYSPLQMHRQALGNAVALQEFEGRFFSQNASPGGAIKVPGNVKTARAREIIDVWEATHGGLHNAHRPAMLTNGAEWEQIGISLQDAQFVEAQRYGVEQVARIWGIAPEMLGHPLTKPEATEQLGLRLLNFTIMPRLRRIEQTFANDPDLFDGQAEYPEFITDAMLRLDAATEASVQLQQVQSGLRLVDELRADDGLAPLPPVPKDWTLEPGKVAQITPVGGAPNPTASTEPPTGNTVTGAAPVPKKSLEQPAGRDLVVIHTEQSRNGHAPTVIAAAPQEPMQLPLEFTDAIASIGRGISELAKRETVVHVDSPVTIAEGAVQISDGAVHAPITVEPSRVDIAEGAVRVDVAPAQVTVEPARVEMAEGMVQVRVDSPPPADVTVTVPERSVTVEAPPPAEVNVKVEPAQVDVHMPATKTRKKAIARRRADGDMEVRYENEED